MKSNNEYDEIKISGATFTPTSLAFFLASRILSNIPSTNSKLNVNDPACGDGELLLSITKLLVDSNYSFNITGSDTSEEYITNVSQRFRKTHPHIPCSFERKDYIEDRNESISVDNELNDIIIANPPYVRTQILGAEKSQAIAKKYNLKGRIDLYFPFLIKMTESLKEGGILGVITSNRYLTTKSGENIRQYLLQNYDVLEIIDLGDTKLFDAAVLPAIFIGRKNTNKHSEINSIFRKIYESPVSQQAINTESIFEFLSSNQGGCYKVGQKYYNYTIGVFKRPVIDTDIWQMTTNEESDFIKTIKANTSFFISDKFKVRVGVKSCADEVFFTKDWDNETKPEDVFMREIISQEDISQWFINDSLRKVVYPHFDNNGKKDVLDISDYPKAKAFFESHQDRLKARTYLMKSKRMWYEYWVPQNPVIWKYPKVVFADISVEPRFAIDFKGAIVDGNCYWFAATSKDEEELLFLIMGVANSKVLERYHDLCFNNKLYSGRRRYLSQYVEKYPIPDPQSAFSKDIIYTVKQLLNTHSKEKIDRLKSEINILVEKSFGLRIK